jgi:hypothetical protein
VEDAIAWHRVVRLLDGVQAREVAADAGLLLVGIEACEHEVVVRNGRLPRVDRGAAGDPVERVDGERRRAVGRGQ